MFDENKFILQETNKLKVKNFILGINCLLLK
jgi:hypothetical protein